LGRQIRHEVVLTANGQGDGENAGADIFGIKSPPPTPDLTQGGGDGLVTVTYEWDPNSLRVSHTDDNGNQTRYAYDNLDRRVTETMGICVAPMLADQCDPPTTTTHQFDPDDNIIRVTDENGSVILSTYDAANRLLATNVTPASAVVGTTAQTFQYDGLSRMTRATDNNRPADTSDDSTITFAYDSLSRVVEETQQIGALSRKVISSAWRAENLRSDLIYPNGRAVEFTYDLLDRMNSVADARAAAPLADYDYIGTDRVLVRHFPLNGTHLTYLDDAGTMDMGYDGLRRPVAMRHLRADDSVIVGFTHTYDRMNNKLSEGKLHDPANDELYAYDSAYRLIDFDRPNAGAIAPLHSQWTLDGVGNWQEVDGETREHTSFNEIAQRDDGAGSVTPLSYDKNGNETDDGTFLFDWDFANRLRKVTRKADGAPVAEYSYDALNRRIRKEVTNSGALDGTTDFYLDGWRVIEERNAADVVTQQYVYGITIDEPLVVDQNTNGDKTAMGAGDQRLFYHQNTQGSVFALTDQSGQIVEAYLYDAYGRATVFAPGANNLVDFGGDDMVTPGGISRLSNPYLFTGRRLDGETGLLYYRYRYHDPETGRFLSRDPVDSGMNRYEYVAGNPLTFVDPMGQFTLIELMLFQNIIRMATATAGPRALIEAPKAAKEAEAIASLRTLVSAQAMYGESDPDRAEPLGSLTSGSLIPGYKSEVWDADWQWETEKSKEKLRGSSGAAADRKVWAVDLQWGTEASQVWDESWQLDELALLTEYAGYLEECPESEFDEEYISEVDPWSADRPKEDFDVADELLSIVVF
jgi:RHS repeat-associated protein